MNERIYYSREAEQRVRQQRVILAVFGMALGLSIGGVMALLLAPHSGEENRKALAKEVNHVAEPVSDATSTALESLRKEFDHLRSDVEQRLKAVM